MPVAKKERRPESRGQNRHNQLSHAKQSRTMNGREWTRIDTKKTQTNRRPDGALGMALKKRVKARTESAFCMCIVETQCVTVVLPTHPASAALSAPGAVW